MNSIITIKRYAIYLLILLVFGCKDNFPESNVAIQDRELWFDASYGLTNEPGKDYPLLDEVAPGEGVLNYTVNLRGPDYPVGKSFHYRVVEGETTAQEGVHYKLVDDGEYIFPGREKEGSIRVEILSFESDSDGSVRLVLELIDGDGVGVDQAYGRIGIPILLKMPPEPTPDTPLYQVLTEGILIEGSTYDNIFLDPSNTLLPVAFRQGFEQARNNMRATGNRRTPVNAFVHFSSTNEVVVVVTFLTSGADVHGRLGRAVMRLRYTFEPDANGVGKFVFKEDWSNGEHRESGVFAPILQDYLEKYEFKVDWVDSGIANPPYPGARLGGLYRIDETTGEPSGDILFGTLEDMDPAETTSSVLRIGLAYSPALYETMVIDPSVRDVGFYDYYNTVIIDPNASYQSAGFKSLWDAANAEVASEGIVLQGWAFFFRPYLSFFDLSVATHYTKNGASHRGRMQFDFRVDNEGVTRPLTFFLYNNGDATTGPESRTDALVDNLLMTNEFKISRNGDRVRFTDKNDETFYFEGELTQHNTEGEFNNRTWNP